MSEASVLFERENQVGVIRLNRPKVLNSLNAEMVDLLYRQLQEWKSDPAIAVVCISGEGTKGLCAGGDMRSLYDLRDSSVLDLARDFFSTEYQMDLLIHQYPKPVVVNMDGIVMGGGVGLSVGATHRIVTEKTKWAMPEMNIGFFPDVGASYFLNQMPGAVGRYLALTSGIIKAADVMYAGAADYYMASDDWDKLKADITSTDWKTKEIEDEMNRLLKRYCQPIDIQSSNLATTQEKINQHFSHETMEEIIASLQSDAAHDEWAKETLTTLLTKSLTSLKVTLRQLQEGEKKSLVECFKMEFILGMNFMSLPDFYEGVRAVLVDKDRSPNWDPSRFEDISEEDILAFFKWDKDDNLLTKFNAFA
ncbi:enoyl-CoA hydratase/isomerase family protein [Alkalihalobacterium chitinilyticum]|uniref:3-hydroxyisobutyryl-CoA hydrolase n=1 Tax=Alkalihalobacterium chitinilyticum TaxID=2980103 RepID=A0ABT5VEE8_9BACI|nr:enoyl-CoA hydratase/isomerase family protein [Alkalihalobacterium chitinilyticum]MDE5413702.1 enoyl-CoA hydratase/isomerase family protein [Alkalihalobacterium chitinilyticum]